MTQMGGYIMGAFGPLFIGWVYDLSGSFDASIITMVVIVLLMISVQMSIALERKATKQQL